MATNDLDEAEELFQKLINEGCLCMEIYDCLADIKNRQGDSDEAQRILERAIEISPNAIASCKLPSIVKSPDMYIAVASA